MKCNKNGLYRDVDVNCGKCCGTGNDWRDDSDLEGFHGFYGLKIKNLIKNIELLSERGVKFFYKNEIPSVEEEREEIIKILSSQKTSITEDIEPPEFTIKYSTKCPICHRENFLGYKNEHGYIILKCISCGGVPARCNDTWYIHTGDRSGEDCEFCGEERASIIDHKIMGTWDKI